MIAFIDDHRGAYGGEPICRVLAIAPSTCHAHAANFGVHGVRKVWCRLGREGKDVARCTVARLMRGMGLQGVVRGREIRTVGNPAAPCPLDRVNRQFRAPRPNAL